MIREDKTGGQGIIPSEEVQKRLSYLSKQFPYDHSTELKSNYEEVIKETTIEHFSGLILEELVKAYESAENGYVSATSKSLKHIKEVLLHYQRKEEQSTLKGIIGKELDEEFACIEVRCYKKATQNSFLVAIYHATQGLAMQMDRELDNVESYLSNYLEFDSAENDAGLKDDIQDLCNKVKVIGYVGRVEVLFKKIGMTLENTKDDERFKKVKEEYLPEILACIEEPEVYNTFHEVYGEDILAKVESLNLPYRVLD